MAETTTTPTKTLKAATDEGVLPIHSLALLGTFDKQDGPEALIRTAGGDFKMVSVGDKVGSSTVMGVEMGVLHLAHSGKMHKLTLPDDRSGPSSPSADMRPVARPESQRG